MKHARPIEAALAAAATLAAAVPATTLVSPPTWVPLAAVVVVAIAVTGVLSRLAGAGRSVTALVQASVATLVVVLVHGQGHSWHGLPTIDAFHALGILLTDAGHEVMRQTAPLPTTRGLALALGILTGLVALLVDVLAVGMRRPAPAGLPLLAAFLGSASNSGDGLGWTWFVAPALLWLSLLGMQGVGALGRWSTVISRGGRTGDPRASHTALARLLGLAALVAAVVVPGLVPHLPTTFVADGLGRGGTGAGGSGRVALSSTVDLSRNLGEQSEATILRFTSSAPVAAPFRVDVLDTYTDGHWRPRRPDGLGGAPTSDLAPTVPRTQIRIDVTDNRVRAPQVAVPAPLTGADFGATAWVTDPRGVVRLAESTDTYTVTYAEIAPRAGDFESRSDEDAAQPYWMGDHELLAVDPGLSPRLESIRREILPRGASRLEAARRIQAWLRSSAFTYSTELIDDGRAEEPLVDFLRTRRGYCVQFATAMVMLARSEGIPARMAIGFLPGRTDGDERVVRGSDAHAWPELWFPRLGWVRFEPTPGARTGTAPAYTLPPSTTPSGSGSSSASPSPSASARPSERPDTGAATSPTSPTEASGPLAWARGHAPQLGVSLLVVAVLGATPLGAWLSRRRRRRRARDDAELVEAEWASLLARLGDLGVAPTEGATPRQAGAQIRHDAYLRGEPETAMGRLVTTLERTRYAEGAPDGADDEARSDADVVWRAAVGGRRPADRVRARLLPTDGLDYWRTFLRRTPRGRRR